MLLNIELISDNAPNCLYIFSASSYYNKACIESLRNNKAEAFDFLKRAIDLDEEYRNKAKTDKDFNNIREEDEFRLLIED